MKAKSRSSSPDEPVTLEKAFRSVVRDELKRAGLSVPASDTADALSPTKMDLFILGIVAADCALALVVFPAADNSAVQNFIKVMQWTGGTIFVAAATWFQKRFVLLSRRTAFRACAAALLLLMLPQQVPLVPVLLPRAADSVSEFLFDKDSIIKSSGRRFVTVSSHTLLMEPADQKCMMKPQPTVTIAAAELWGDLRRQRVMPLYSNIYANFPQDEDNQVDKVLAISRAEGSFQPQELDIVRKGLATERTGRLRGDASASPKTITIEVSKSTAASQLMLASGVYDLRLRDDRGTCLGRICGRLDEFIDEDCLLRFERTQCSASCP